jgi:hypothetical protein
LDVAEARNNLLYPLRSRSPRSTACLRRMGAHIYDEIKSDYFSDYFDEKLRILILESFTRSTSRSHRLAPMEQSLGDCIWTWPCDDGFRCHCVVCWNKDFRVPKQHSIKPLPKRASSPLLCCRQVGCGGGGPPGELAQGYAWRRHLKGG